MKNTPGSWKSAAKAPVPCSVFLAGAWSERGKLMHSHSPRWKVEAARGYPRVTRPVAEPQPGHAQMGSSTPLAPHRSHP